MGVAPDWYGGRPGPVWGAGIGIVNIGYIELGSYFCLFFALLPSLAPGLQRSPTPRPGMGVTPDRYGGRPGPVWGSPRTGMGARSRDN